MIQASTRPYFFCQDSSFFFSLGNPGISDQPRKDGGQCGRSWGGSESLSRIQKNRSNPRGISRGTSNLALVELAGIIPVLASVQILVLLVESGLWRDTLLSEFQLWSDTVHEILRIIGYE